MGSEYRFVPDVWISFNYEGQICVGRTFLLDGIEVVAAVSSTGNIGHIPFDEIKNPKQLRFIENIDKKNQNVFELSKVNIKDFDSRPKEKLKKSELLMAFFKN